MNIFACMLKIVLVIFSKFLGYPINSTYSSKSLFFLRVLYSDYHGKMSFLSFSWIIKKKKNERSYPTPKVRGGDRECQAATAQEQVRGATPHSRSGGVTSSKVRSSSYTLLE